MATSVNIFDGTYYALGITLILILTSAIVLGLRTRARMTDTRDRSWALGISLAALGALVTIVETVSLKALSRSGTIGGFLYQQVIFSIAYIGFAMVLYGIDATIYSKVKLGSNLKSLRILVWSSFFLAIAFSSSFLFNSSSYTVTRIGSQEHVAQQLVFWLPLFLTLIIGAVASSVVALRSNGTPFRRYSVWLALFSALIFVGTLRESTIIPSAGDPLTDLLVAFAPFTAGSFCILMSVRSLRFVKNDMDALWTVLWTS